MPKLPDDKANKMTKDEDDVLKTPRYQLRSAASRMATRAPVTEEPAGAEILQAARSRLRSTATRGGGGVVQRVPATHPEANVEKTAERVASAPVPVSAPVRVAVHVPADEHQRHTSVPERSLQKDVDSVNPSIQKMKGRHTENDGTPRVGDVAVVSEQRSGSKRVAGKRDIEAKETPQKSGRQRNENWTPEPSRHSMTTRSRAKGGAIVDLMSVFEPPASSEQTTVMVSRNRPLRNRVRSLSPKTARSPSPQTAREPSTRTARSLSPVTACPRTSVSSGSSSVDSEVDVTEQRLSGFKHENALASSGDEDATSPLRSDQTPLHHLCAENRTEWEHLLELHDSLVKSPLFRDEPSEDLVDDFKEVLSRENTERCSAIVDSEDKIQTVSNSPSQSVSAEVESAAQPVLAKSFKAEPSEKKSSEESSHVQQDGGLPNEEGSFGFNATSSSRSSETAGFDEKCEERWNSRYSFYEMEGSKSVGLWSSFLDSDRNDTLDSHRQSSLLEVHNTVDTINSSGNEVPPQVQKMYKSLTPDEILFFLSSSQEATLPPINTLSITQQINRLTLENADVTSGLENPSENERTSANLLPSAGMRPYMPFTPSLDSLDDSWFGQRSEDHWYGRYALAVNEAADPQVSASSETGFPAMNRSLLRLSSPSGERSTLMTTDSYAQNVSNTLETSQRIEEESSSEHIQVVTPGDSSTRYHTQAMIQQRTVSSGSENNAIEVSSDSWAMHRFSDMDENMLRRYFRHILRREGYDPQNYEVTRLPCDSRSAISKSSSANSTSANAFELEENAVGVRNIPELSSQIVSELDVFSLPEADATTVASKSAIAAESSRSVQSEQFDVINDPKDNMRTGDVDASKALSATENSIDSDVGPKYSDATDEDDCDDNYPITDESGLFD